MTSRPAVVGGFILGAFALGVAGILFFGGMQLFATNLRVVVFFSESVAGLDVGAPVTFHGVRIGSVKSIAIHFSANTMTARIPVNLELMLNRLILEGKKLNDSETDIQEVVRAGLRAQLVMESFVTGQMRVDLDFRPGTPARLFGAEGTPEIPTVPSDFNQLRNQLAQLQLPELADAAKQAFSSLGRVSDHLDATLDPLVQSVRGAADAATQTLQTAEGAVRQVQAEASIALRDLHALLVDADRQLDARGGELSHALTGADRAIRKAQTLLDSLNGLVEPRSQVRGDLEAAIHDLAVTASSLRNFAATVERNPNTLLMGRGSR